MELLKFYFILCIILSNLAHAEIYKCIDDSGKTKYQSKECDDDEQSKVMEIKNLSPKKVDESPKLKKISNEKSFEDRKKSIDSQTVKFLKKQKKRKCALLKKRFNAAEKQVIDKCKRNREVFCGLSAVQIEKNERQKAIRQITGSYGSGTVTIPAYSHVEILQKEYEDYGCR